jgi:hypothetical protein
VETVAGCVGGLSRVLHLHLSAKLLSLSKFPVRLLLHCIQTVIIFKRGTQHHVLCLSFTTGGVSRTVQQHTLNVTHGTKNRHTAAPPSPQTEVSTGHIYRSITAPSAEPKPVLTERYHYITAPQYIKHSRRVLNSAVQPTDTVREHPHGLISHHNVTQANQRKNGL